MDLKIYSAHTGKSLNVPYNVNSLPELKRWIAKELGITEKYLVLMTPRGSQVKPQYWADESEIFAFDREFLSKRGNVVAATSQFEIPSLASPPDTSSITTTRTPLKTHVTHLRARAVWARSIATQSEEIKTRIDTVNSEIVVLQTAAKIALVNLGNVSRSLQRAFTDTEVLAEKKLGGRKQTLDRIPGGIKVLDGVKVHPVFGKEEQTLGDFFDKEDLQEAIGACAKTNDDVEKRIKELKGTMEEFILQGEGLKQEVLEWTVETVKEAGQVREIQLIADKIERDYNHISDMTNVQTALSASTRSFQNHTREYIPNLQNAASSLLNILEQSCRLRTTVSTQSQTYLQRLSSAQERMVSIGPRLAEADDFFAQSQHSYDLLQGLPVLAKRHGEGLLEGFRRGLWKVRRARQLEKARQEVALLRAQERRARKAWGDVSSDGGVVWGFVDELSSDEDANSPPNGVDSEGSPVNRKDIEKYISTISKGTLFESTAQSLKEHLQVLLSSIGSQDAATSPIRQDSSDGELPPVQTREGSGIYEQLLQDKQRAEERARNFESRVKNLEEMLHRQFRTPPRNFSPVPVPVTNSSGGSPQLRGTEFDEHPLLGRSMIRTASGTEPLQKRIAELEREKEELMERLNDTEGTKNDLMANLEEQTKLFQAEREDLVREKNDLERQIERHETEINRYEELVPKMESEVDTLRTGRQNLLREMNLLQTESGAKIKELEEAKVAVEERVRSLERDGESAAAEQERIASEWRKASIAAEDAHIEIEKFRRLSDENQVEHDRLHEVQEELRTATAKLGDLEQQQNTMEEQNSMAVKVLHDELSTLRDRIADILGLEKRRWETDSLLHAVTQKLATKDQKVNESDGTITSLTKETKLLSSQLAKSKALCASRTLKARDLTQRLYTNHTRCRQLLETLGLAVKSTNGSPLLRYPSSEKSTDFLEPDDLDLLYWMESGDSDEEADKYSRYLGRVVIDLDAFVQAITNRVRDAEKYAKKWQKEARAYREKAKKYAQEAETKIAFRGFKDGDLALFLPTNNGRPWAAFNVNAPHYFLREEEAHRLGGGRDWLLARISKVEERTVDLSAHVSDVEDHNPFDLADGLRWYYLDAVEEKPSTIASRELARSVALQKSAEKRSASGGARSRMSQSTPGLIPGREDGGALTQSVIQEEGET